MRSNATAKFKELFWPLLPSLLRTATGLTRGDAHAAEDLVQETMIKAWRAIDTFQDETHPKSWIFTILKRTHIDTVRRTIRHPELLNASLENQASSDHASLNDSFSDSSHDWNHPDLIMESIDDQEIASALLDLPEAMRWTLLLCDVEGLEQSEAAIVLGIPVGTVKSRAYHGRRMLREQLVTQAKRYRINKKTETAPAESCSCNNAECLMPIQLTFSG